MPAMQHVLPAHRRLRTNIKISAVPENNRISPSSKGAAMLRSVASPTRNAMRIATNRNSVTRSEEHTSELQSLMRTSYAVFCLKQQRHKPETPPSHLQSHM